MTDPGSCGHLLESAERDRHRELARAAAVLHDDVGQMLTAMGLQLDLLELDHPAVSPAIAALRPKIEAAFASVRALMGDLNPDLVVRAGILTALEGLALRVGCEFAGHPIGGLAPGQASALYRIAECAVDNALRHARAAKIVIQLSGAPLCLRIRDDGVGFDLSRAQAGYGLLLMQHLARTNNLEIVVHSAPGRGTIIEILSDNGANGNAV